MFGKATIENSNVWKSQNSEFQCLGSQNPEFQLKKGKIQNSDVWKS